MYIVSIRVTKRNEEVPELQSILTRYGKNISARLGLHNLDNKEKDGMIIIVYNSEDVEAFIEELNLVQGVSVKHMES